MSFNWVAARPSPPEDSNLHCVLSRIQCPVGWAEPGSTTQEKGHAGEGEPEETGYLGTGTPPCTFPRRSRVARVATPPLWASLTCKTCCPRSIIPPYPVVTRKVALIPRHHVLRRACPCQLPLPQLLSSAPCPPFLLPFLSSSIPFSPGCLINIILIVKCVIPASPN